MSKFSTLIDWSKSFGIACLVIAVFIGAIAFWAWQPVVCALIIGLTLLTTLIHDFRKEDFNEHSGY